VAFHEFTEAQKATSEGNGITSESKSSDLQETSKTDFQSGVLTGLKLAKEADAKARKFGAWADFHSLIAEAKKKATPKE
jgi:hypothetical protein